MKEIIRSHTIVLALFAAGLGSRMLAVAQTLDFGEQVVGTTSGPKQVIGCCQGGYPFGNGFTLTFIGDFLRGSSSTCRSQMFLSPGQTCVLFVVFAPKQVGPRIGRVIYNKIGYGSDVDIQDLSGTGMALKPPPPPPLPPPSPLSCDVNRDGGFTILDVHSLVNQILGVALPTSDVNGDSIVNVIDLQRVVNAVLGLGCNSTL